MVRARALDAPGQPSLKARAIRLYHGRKACRNDQLKARPEYRHDLGNLRRRLAINHPDYCSVGFFAPSSATLSWLIGSSFICCSFMLSGLAGSSFIGSTAMPL